MDNNNYINNINVIQDLGPARNNKILAEIKYVSADFPNRVRLIQVDDESDAILRDYSSNSRIYNALLKGGNFYLVNSGTKIPTGYHRLYIEYFNRAGRTSTNLVYNLEAAETPKKEELTEAEIHSRMAELYQLISQYHSKLAQLKLAS